MSSDPFNPLQYRSTDDAAEDARAVGRTVATWAILAGVWVVGLAVWVVYLALIAVAVAGVLG